MLYDSDPNGFVIEINIGTQTSLTNNESIIKSQLIIADTIVSMSNKMINWKTLKTKFKIYNSTTL